MDRFKNLQKDHQTSLKLWLKVFKIFGINIFDSSSLLLKVLFTALMFLYNLHRLLGGTIQYVTMTNKYPFVLFFMLAFYSSLEMCQWVFICLTIERLIDLFIFVLEDFVQKSWSMEEFWNGRHPVDMFLIAPLGIILTNIFSANYRCLHATLAINVSLLFLSLQGDIESVIEAQRSELQESELEERLKNIIRFHQSVIRIAYELSDVYSMSCFFHVFATTLILGVQGFLAMKLVNFGFVVGCFITTVWLYVLHWSGQLVADTSEGVADAAYSCLWYTKSRRIKTMLLTIMIRSQTPVHLTAWKFAIVRLDNLRMILSEAWSYVSLLTSLSASSSSSSSLKL